jgi:hypothetical protein
MGYIICGRFSMKETFCLSFSKNSGQAQRSKCGSNFKPVPSNLESLLKKAQVAKSFSSKAFSFKVIRRRLYLLPLKKPP